MSFLKKAAKQVKQSVRNLLNGDDYDDGDGKKECPMCSVLFASHGYDFCSEKCSARYRKLIRNSKRSIGRRNCRFPRCNNLCYVDTEREVQYDFCSKSHATDYEELIRMSSQCGCPVCWAITLQKSKINTHQIFFYKKHEPYYEFTNFAKYSIVLDGRRWHTSEHYYQAQKFVGTPYYDYIHELEMPRDALNLCRLPEVSQWCRKDWDMIKLRVMYKALLAKFSQHDELRDMLLKTGDRELVEHTSNDSFWGDGGDGSGQNHLGKLLMKLRYVLNSLLKESRGKFQPNINNPYNISSMNDVCTALPNQATSEISSHSRGSDASTCEDTSIQNHSTVSDPSIQVISEIPNQTNVDTSCSSDIPLASNSGDHTLSDTLNQPHAVGRSPQLGQISCSLGTVV